MWRIVFVGNCQAHVLADIFRRAIDPILGTQTRHIASHDPLGPDAFALLEKADVLVEQRFDFPPPVAEALATRPLRARRIAFPNCDAGFLWPYAYEGHPRNIRAPHVGGEGPFTAELGDAFLNRLLSEGVDGETALERYLAHDIVSEARLERRREMGLAAQARRDAEAGGYGVAALLRTKIQAEPLFLTPRHPGRHVFFAILERLGEMIGLPPWLIHRLPHALHVLPFFDEELPLHPAVARHFGLGWAGEARRYHLWWAGRITFADYVRIYMTFDWNESLVLGRHLAGLGDHDGARTAIEAGLAAAPHVAGGWRLLSHVRTALGDHDGARAAIGEALQREPHVADDWVHLGNLCLVAGDPRGAATAYRAALAVDPAYRPALSAWAALRDRTGGAAGRAEAAALFERLARDDPYDAEPFLALGHVRAQAGEAAAAVAAFRLAALAAPFRADIRQAFSYALAAAGEGAAALNEGEAALALAPADRAFRRHLLTLAWQSGGLSRARALFLRLQHTPSADATLGEDWLALLEAAGENAEAAAFAQILSAQRFTSPPSAENGGRQEERPGASLQFLPVHEKGAPLSPVPDQGTVPV